MNNRQMDEVDKRVHSRSDFSFPARVTVYAKDYASKHSFDGYIKNMSMNGACIQFEDRYGRVDPGVLKGSRIKLAIKIPRGDRVVLNASIHWARKDRPNRSFLILAGVELMDIEDWQVEQIEKLIKLKNKDHKMIWNLMEHYLE